MESCGDCHYRRDAGPFSGSGWGYEPKGQLDPKAQVQPDKNTRLYFGTLTGRCPAVPATGKNWCGKLNYSTKSFLISLWN